MHDGIGSVVTTSCPCVDILALHYAFTYALLLDARVALCAASSGSIEFMSSVTCVYPIKERFPAFVSSVCVGALNLSLPGHWPRQCLIRAAAIANSVGKAFTAKAQVLKSLGFNDQ